MFHPITGSLERLQSTTTESLRDGAIDDYADIKVMSARDHPKLD